MPSEISAFLQAQAQIQTPQTNNISSDKEASQPGLFDEFVNSFISQEIEINQEAELIDIRPEMTFTGNNSFSQSVIDILAGELNADDAKNISEDVQGIITKIKSAVSDKVSEIESELPEKIDDIVSRVLNDESIPEDVKNELMNSLDELVNVIKSSDSINDDVKDFAVKLSDIVHEHIDAPKVNAPVVEEEKDIDDEEHADDEKDVAYDEDDVSDVSVSIAGSSMIISEHEDTVSALEPEAQPEFSDMNRQAQTPSNESRIITHNSDAKPQKQSRIEDTHEQSKEQEANHSTGFDEHLESSDSENRTSNQNAQSQSQSQSQNQNGSSSGQEENSSGHNQSDSAERSSTSTSTTSSSTRTESRKSSGTTSRTQNERTDSNTHRTESHNTFQSFFEGVLSNRRSAARTSPLPLNLQTGTYALNQSQTLRDGMINVVRFIRADGVQKANVVVDPPALGRISVELSSTSSGVEASIKVASEQIRQLVQDQLLELRMNLSQQGVQVAEFTVDVQQDNSGNSNHQGSQYGKEQRAYAINEADDDTEEFRIDLEEGLLYWVA